MKYVLDTHTHTLASGHAYSTIKEMAEAARDFGLELLGITEHAPSMPGTCNWIYFSNLRVNPKEIYGVELMYGVELNIIDYEGRVDLKPAIMKGLDLRIASLHNICIQPGNKEENTRAIIGAMKNPYVQIIGHPDDTTFPLDMEQIVLAAKETKTLLEVNNNSLNPAGSRVGADITIREMLKLCKEHQVPIIMNSDAHVYADVGRRDFSVPVVEEMEFPEELIVNRSVEAFKTALKAKEELYK